MNLQVDPKRHAETMRRSPNGTVTGVFVRAQLEGVWGSHDIALLDSESLLDWLRSRGGNNPWAENIVGVLLGHGHLHP